MSQTFPPDVRRLWPSDLPAFRDHLLRLDDVSRHLRFGGGVSSTFLTHYAQRCFGAGDLVFGAFVDGALRGAAELRSDAAIWAEQAPLDRHIHAEAAFSVETGFRKAGLGAKLFARILEAAGNHGVEVIEIVCLPENVAMRRLAAKFKAQFVFQDDQLLGRLTARRPTPLSIWREAARDVADFGKAAFDAQARFGAQALLRP